MEKLICLRRRRRKDHRKMVNLKRRKKVPMGNQHQQQNPATKQLLPKEPKLHQRKMLKQFLLKEGRLLRLRRTQVKKQQRKAESLKIVTKRCSKEGRKMIRRRKRRKK